ncbi:hypothetical protein GCK32_022440, partial [Trichostrongylus colubriformis]
MIEAKLMDEQKEQLSMAPAKNEREPRRHTCWNSVLMAGFVTFLSAVENTVVGMSEWPYMHT